MNGELTLLWAFAAAMVGVTAWLVKKASRVETLYDASVVLFLLVMMASMFASSVYYLYSPGVTTIIELLVYNMMAMSALAIPVGYYVFFGDKPLSGSTVPGIASVRALLKWSVIVPVIASEVLMGWTFALASGSARASGGLGGVYSAIIGSASSYWFVFTMAAEMAITVFFMRKRLARRLWWIVAAQVAVMFLSPTAIASASWSRYSTFAGSAVMVVLFIYVFELLYRDRKPAPAVSGYLVRIMLAYALMMAGVFIWLLEGDATVFVISLLVEMGAYFSLVLEPPGGSPADPLPWQSRPAWVFAMLGLLFAAEFFMGGAIDVYAYGAGYFTNLPLAPVGASVAALPAALYDFIMYFSQVTASPWYLIMMGVEMGALVLFQMGHARELETKVRLGMVIAAYAVYTVLIPYFVLPNSVQYVPWFGWAMGIGTSGALAPAVLVALVATYVVSGLLSFLFGSRNVCSAFCMAALMYQGTTFDAMSSFNRTSRLGRKFLTSRISSVYKWAASMVWLSLIASAALSYLNSAGILAFSFFGTDASFFAYSFYFSFLWYIVWIAMPFVGTYGCVNTGMCGWGSFNQLVSRLGLFKLKVTDSDVCVSCKTRDCAKVCPVGITDQPGTFIAKGELKSMKCIGVGDCVSACPYENIYFYDVRGWLRERMRRPGSPRRLALVSADADGPDPAGRSGGG